MNGRFLITSSCKQTGQINKSRMSLIYMFVLWPQNLYSNFFFVKNMLQDQYFRGMRNPLIHFYNVLGRVTGSDEPDTQSSVSSTSQIFRQECRHTGACWIPTCSFNWLTFGWLSRYRVLLYSTPVSSRTLYNNACCDNKKIITLRNKPLSYVIFTFTSSVFAWNVGVRIPGKKYVFSD